MLNWIADKLMKIVPLKTIQEKFLSKFLGTGWKTYAGAAMILIGAVISFLMGLVQSLTELTTVIPGAEILSTLTAQIQPMITRLSDWSIHIGEYLAALGIYHKGLQIEDRDE